jgi:hypothetical protein
MERDSMVIECNTNLVGGIPTPLQNMKVNGKGYPMYYEKINNV